MVVAVAVLLTGTDARADRMEVEASLDPGSGRIEGTFDWTIENSSGAPISHVDLFVYPQQYAADPALDDILMPRVYPGAFDPGGQQLLCDHDPVDAADVPVVRIALPAALPPGASTVVQCRFTTQVPRKYGTFGRTRRTVTMNGGLHPMPVTRTSEPASLYDAPPPPVDYDLDLDVPEGWGVVVGGELRADGLSAQLVPDAIVPSGPRRWLSVSVQRDLERQNLPLSDGHSVTFVGRPLKRFQKRWLRRAAEDVRTTLSEHGLADPERGIVLVEAPLRRNLVEVGDGVVYVSDRFFEAAAPFWRYHDLHLARALLADALSDLVDAREEPRNVPITLDGVSWSLVPDYLEHRWKNHQNLKQLLERVRFLPAVDTLLETPVFPFADQIFDDPWVVDPLRADVRRFNRPLRSGRVLFLKLDDLVGPTTVDRAAATYVAAGPEAESDFWELLSARSGRDVRRQAEHWLLPASRQNLSVESVVRSRDDAGFHTTVITVRREALLGETPEEVVEVRVDSARPGKKGRATLRWEGREEVATWEVRTAGRAGAVTIDPRGRVLEIDDDGISQKRDNRLPGTIRVTGYAYLIALDATGAGLDGYAALNFRPSGDTRHHVLTRAFTNTETRLGGGTSYVRYFGPKRVGSYRRHRVVFSADFNWLNPAFRATDAPFVIEGRGSYIYESRASAFYPTRGGRFTSTVFLGKDIALKDDLSRPLADSGYIGINVTGVRLFRLHPWHVLAVRGKAGVLAGAVVHRQFTLGGVDDLRGIPANHVVGNFRASATVEWRHLFFRDADIPLVLYRLRGVQGALFVEGGFVTDPSRAPRPEEAGISIGYGLRVFGDWFGVLPSIGGIEIAWSPGAPDGRIPALLPYERWPRVPFQVYIVGSQSF